MSDLVPERLECPGGLEPRVDDLGPRRGVTGRDAPVDRRVVDHVHPFLHARVDVTPEPYRV